MNWLFRHNRLFVCLGSMGCTQTAMGNITEQKVMKIICIGRNYAEHAAEPHEQLNDSGKLPEEPMFFMKPDTTALLRNNDPFWRSVVLAEVHA